MFAYTFTRKAWPVDLTTSCRHRHALARDGATIRGVGEKVHIHVPVPAHELPTLSSIVVNKPGKTASGGVFQTFLARARERESVCVCVCVAVVVLNGVCFSAT
jgi:hypothetical protein